MTDNSSHFSHALSTMVFLELYPISPGKVLLLIKRIEVEAVSKGSVTVRPLSI